MAIPHAPRLLGNTRRGSPFWLGLIAIGATALLWGHSNVVVRQLEASMPPSLLILLRFGIGSICMLPFLWRVRLSRRDRLLGLGGGVALGMSSLWRWKRSAWTKSCSSALSTSC